MPPPTPTMPPMTPMPGNTLTFGDQIATIQSIISGLGPKMTAYLVASQAYTNAGNVANEKHTNMMTAQAEVNLAMNAFQASVMYMPPMTPAQTAQSQELAAAAAAAALNQGLANIAFNSAMMSFTIAEANLQAAAANIGTSFNGINSTWSNQPNKFTFGWMMSPL